MLKTIGAENFDVVVCGDDVRMPKPDPEPYRTAATLLGVPIEDCVAWSGETTPDVLVESLRAIDGSNVSSSMGCSLMRERARRHRREGRGVGQPTGPRRGRAARWPAVCR